MSETIAIAYEGEEQYTLACKLAHTLHLDIDNQARQQLLVTADGLLLKVHPFLPLQADFSSVSWKKRHDEGKKQGLIKACRPAKGMRIIDATAGWGRDAAILASFGAKVMMLERNPVMAVLLEDALQRRDEPSREALQLKVVNQDAMDYLAALHPEDFPDVIYIDPMHPKRQKSPLVKKEMQVLQQIAGVDHDVQALVCLARTRVRERVVLKWPQSLAPVVSPTGSITGTTVRFDIFCSV